MVGSPLHKVLKGHTVLKVENHCSRAGKPKTMGISHSGHGGRVPQGQQGGNSHCLGEVRIRAGRAWERRLGLD